MDMNALHDSILTEEACCSLAVLSDTGEDVETDDFYEDRRIRYHLVPPTLEWLKSRILWGKSITGDLDLWTDAIANTLLRIDPAMLICLNRVCIIAEESDIEPLCNAMNADTEGFPECIEFEDNKLLGCKWHLESSIVINATAIKAAIMKMADEYEGLYFDAAQEIEIGFTTTLLHEIRHLGMECNPFLPEDEYPKELCREAEVEDWALSAYESL